jgi:hypothetical protein
MSWRRAGHPVETSALRDPHHGISVARVAAHAIGGRMYRISTICALTATLSLGSTLAAQRVTKTETVTGEATIQAIDTTSRILTLKTQDGTEDTVYAPPAMKRFSELKVGDKVKVRYYESVVLDLRKPGAATNAAGDVTKATTGKGPSPGGTIARQVTMTVSVVAVDPNTSSITVKTPDGRTVVRKVENKKNLEGVSPGDKIDITYTQAALIEIEPAK